MFGKLFKPLPPPAPFQNPDQQLGWFSYAYANALCDRGLLPSLYHPFALEGTPYILRIDAVYDTRDSIGFTLIILEGHQRLGSLSLNRHNSTLLAISKTFDQAFLKSLLPPAKRLWQTSNMAVPDCVIISMNFPASTVARMMPDIVSP